MKISSHQFTHSLEIVNSEEITASYKIVFKWSLLFMGLGIFNLLKPTATYLQFLTWITFPFLVFLFENKRYLHGLFGQNVSFGSTLVTISTLNLSYQYSYASISEIKKTEKEGLIIFTFKTLTGLNILSFNQDQIDALKSFSNKINDQNDSTLGSK